MCAPHQGTLMEDCTSEEAMLLLGIAGYNANPEFLDLYLRATSSNPIYGPLRFVAENRHDLKAVLLSFPDNPEGGRQALDSLRSFMKGSPSQGCSKKLPMAVTEDGNATQTAKKSCCH